MYRILPHLTATPLQATTYLAGLALFSISFLVFLTSSLSFVITDVIGQHSGVGNAVGTLGFADELVALVACPLWGLISDRVGVRWVAVAGYVVIGLSLACLVQSSAVFPDLVIWRMVFSLGAAACTTMVTAVLPAMTAVRKTEGTETQTDGGEIAQRAPEDGSNRHSLAPSVSSELTITPVRYESTRARKSSLLARYRRRRRSVTNVGKEGTEAVDPDMDTSRIAGFVGMFTGIGALIALALFLPLPVTLGKGVSKAQAVQNSFYIVGCVALVVALLVGVGLRGLPGEEGKGFSLLFSYDTPSSSTKATSDDENSRVASAPKQSYFSLLSTSLFLGLTDSRIFLGYAGGFVARASSVGISTFIPLFVNAYFIRTGACSSNPGEPIKDSCKEAYKLASMLTGISQLVALLAAPLYGFFQARYAKGPVLGRIPLGLAATAGLVGNLVFANLQTPDVKQRGGHGAIIAVVLIGIGQIGAIVCSLGILAQGIRNASSSPVAEAVVQRSSNVAGDNGSAADAEGETAPLLPDSAPAGAYVAVESRAHLKGSIAGVYSLAGGAAILLLTKLGGYLFDVASSGAPFYLLAGFNAMLLVAVVAVTGGSAIRSRMSNGDSEEQSGDLTDERG